MGQHEECAWKRSIAVSRRTKLIALLHIEGLLGWLLRYVRAEFAA
jgi:hypothetical protein